MANKKQIAVLRKGAAAWNVWRAAHPDAIVDMAGADLSAVDMDEADLRAANLDCADLRNATLRNADLTGAALRAANLNGADLAGAKLGEARLEGANLSGASLVSAHLVGANLSETNLNRVKWDVQKMRGKFRAIRGLESCYGDALFKRAAADQDFLDTLEAHWEGQWRIALFRLWGWATDYGRSVPRVIFLATTLALFYGWVYASDPDLLSYGAGKAPTWFSPFYFSIVTYTTLGFGDVTPRSALGEIVVCSEVILGYLTLGLLLSILVDKLARRS
jgi:Ion channel/Pentapeptide repeats (8 copies)